MYVTTFYSFKGGVGRSMALVNVAAELSSRGKKVLIVDFDLEAPGLQTYEPFAHSQLCRGVVDYVTAYMETRTAPDVSEFVSQHQINDTTIWLMPAGMQDDQYASRLNSIDWLTLYEEYDGFLMFEDLKQQWRALKFDYVLVDSRTGHTDVGGICTRQLPDAAVLMFFPNDQNISGLSEIVKNIRLEADGPRSKKISIHFCPSNVPDLDDDEQILQRHLEGARKWLDYDAPASIIHHYQSMSLLDQPIFVMARPKTRLSEEYRGLVNNVVAGNLEDKAGALARLEQLRAEFRTSRGIPNLSEFEELLRHIYTSHKGDGEVAWSLSLVYDLIGNTEAQLETLGIAIAHHVNESRARSKRAMLLSKSEQADLARDDLRAVILMPEVSSADLIGAIERLSEIDPEWLNTVERSEAIHKLTGRNLSRVANALMIDGRGAALAADLLRKVGEPDRTQSNNLILALIGMGDFAGAMSLLGSREEILRSKGIEVVFNFACAKWGETTVADLDVFRRVIELSQADDEAFELDANFPQCLAISYYVLGEYGKAREFVSRARRAIADVPPGRIFSAWRFLNVSRKDFQGDLEEMRLQMEMRGNLVPKWRKAMVL